MLRARVVGGSEGCGGGVGRRREGREGRVEG